MSIQQFFGRPMLLGPDPFLLSTSGISTIDNAVNGANISNIYVGRIRTSDGGSHTINTTGSSSLQWRTGGTNTFASGSTTLVVGLAAVDTANGPPARAVNSAGVITFDVSASFTGGSGFTSNSWQTNVPTAGTKTIANGDLVAFAVQMTTRGGTDSVNAEFLRANNATPNMRPCITTFNGSTYARTVGAPNCLITFSDGALGWFEGGEIYSTITTRTFNNGSSPNEYGQLFQMPFPMRVCGAYGVIQQSANINDCDIVLYSDPLGTPIAQQTASIDAETISTTGNNFFTELFPSSYDVPANTPVGITFKPSSVNSISAYLKTLNGAAHRVADPFGTTGYGISRSSGAFANANSSLDHYYIGLLLSGFDGGGGGGGAMGARIFTGM